MLLTVKGIDYSPEMVATAEKRRGIKLILANASQMPFEKSRFKTTIVSTGVLDFIDDPD
jgi:ubiquinone/menaquinone biosynthesis C-methylase UbiE